MTGYLNAARPLSKYNREGYLFRTYNFGTIDVVDINFAVKIELVAMHETIQLLCWLYLRTWQRQALKPLQAARSLSVSLSLSPSLSLSLSLSRALSFHPISMHALFSIYLSRSLLCASLSWQVSILKEHGMFQTKCIVCIERQSQSQLIGKSAVITSVMTVLLCGQEIG